MIDYSKLRQWADPPTLTSRPQWSALLNWVISVISVPNDRISFLFLEITNAQLDALKTNCPFIIDCDVSLESFRSVLFHLTNPPRFSDQEKANLETLLKTAIGASEQESRDILLAYYPATMPPAPSTTILDLFLHWARAMLTLLVYSFNKTSADLELLQAYKSFVHITSRAGPLLQSLDLRITDCNDAHNL